ncbi:MAG: ribosome assembly factor SBDS [Candidatus Altiarchaeota archaeon]
MANLDEAIIIRLKTRGHTFEVLADPDKALEFRSGEEVSIDNVLAVEHVFKDAKAGDKASSDLMEEAFNTSEESKVAEEVLKKGELHLTTEQKRRMLEERRKQVASLIARDAINPQTKSPHPQSRILQAMEEAKVEVTLSKSPREHVEKVLKALIPLMPIKLQKVQVALKVPAAHTGRLYEVLKEYGEVKKDEWVGQEQYCLIEIPGGLQDELFNKLNSMTHGEISIKVL